MKYYLAIDIGASSGRHIVGWLENGELMTDELYRFPNGMDTVDGHLVWDSDRLLREVETGIAECFKKYPTIESLSIDTWGVDYVLLKGDKEVYPTYAYRDSRVEGPIEEVHSIIPFAELYERTGIQFNKFNTIYQLYADKLAGRLEGVTDFLMIPEYLMYKLTGNKVKEFTNATTAGLINADTLRFDGYIFDKLGLPEALISEVHQPGTLVGRLTPEVEARVGGNLDVVLCATHDTGSAVEAIEMQTDAPYVSSGTWSLLGIEQEKAHTDAQSLAVNYSNEGSLNFTFRYQQNIMGLWMLQSIRRELSAGRQEPISFGEIADMARSVTGEGTVDVNHPDFLAPKSMIGTVRAHAPWAVTDAQVIRCVYDSLAACYAASIEALETTVGKKYDTLHIIGGGSRDALLNELTAKTTGKRILTGPTEATALGNLLMQMIAAGELADLAAARALIRNSVELGEF